MVNGNGRNSKQKETILRILMGTTSHPTADGKNEVLARSWDNAGNWASPVDAIVTVIK